MDDATDLAEALLGLSEYRLLAVAEFPESSGSASKPGRTSRAVRVGGPRSRPRTHPGRHPGPALFRPAVPGSAG